MNVEDGKEKLKNFVIVAVSVFLVCVFHDLFSHLPILFNICLFSE